MFFENFPAENNFGQYGKCKKNLVVKNFSVHLHQYLVNFQKLNF